MLLIAAFAFGKGSPRLRAWIETHPRFGPPVRRWQRERAIAPRIHQTLQAMREALQAGRARAEVEREASAALAEAGFAPDYAVIRTPEFAEPADGEPGPRVALIAARLGRTRLIDNLEFALD